MKTLIIGMLAETFIHPGSGRNSGVIDLPVMREAATDYPFIAGQSLKGALKDHARQQDLPEEQVKQQVKELFGESDKGGAFRCGDARLLLLPVRSLNGAYKWATCPHILERFVRDCRRCFGIAIPMQIPQPPQNSIYCSGSGTIFLEERHFTIAGAVPAVTVAAALEPLFPHVETSRRLANQMAILSDADFCWFARFGLAVQARNELYVDTKTTRNLWYEESLPPDTLMYSIISESKPGKISDVKKLLNDRPYLQTGGNETVGQGWFALQTIGPLEAAHA